MTINTRLLRQRLRLVLSGGFFAGLLLFAAWPWLPLPGKATGRERTVVFYGFSILGETMNKSVLPAFQAEWRRRTGEQVAFITSFAGSGTVTNQVIMGV